MMRKIERMKRSIFLLALLGFGFGLGLKFVFEMATSPALAQAIAIDKALVVVNEQAITLSDYRARYRQEVLQNESKLTPFDGSINPRILNRMIDDRIQSQIALRRGIRVSRQEVERAVAFIANQNDFTAKELYTQLAADGVTAAQFRARMQEQQLIRRLVDGVVGSRVKVSNQEVKNYLASHRDLIESNEEYEISHLFVSLNGKSDDEVQTEMENLAHIREAVVEGRSFEKSAEEFSDGPGREQGGYLGWRKIDQLQPLFADALRQTEVGGVSKIIRSDNGLHLLKMHDRKGEGKMVEQQLLRHILIRPNAELSEQGAAEFANELYARIIAGEDFESIARVHSAERSTGDKGGRLGWVSPGDFPAQLESSVARLAVNELSKPLRDQSGYHLVEILDRRQVDISMEMAARRARQLIFQRKAAAFYDNWYGAIRDAAHIEYISVAEQ